MRKPVGHIRRHGTGYQVIVPAGIDPITKRYRYQYEQVDTFDEAEAARDRMLADLAAGREPRTKATFGELLDRMLEVADLDFTTRGLRSADSATNKTRSLPISHCWTMSRHQPRPA